VAGFLDVMAATLGGGVTALGLVQAGRAFWTARLLSGSGATPMTELSEGLQEVRGTPLAEGAVTAPLSGRPCLHWRLLVEQQRRTRWETVLDKRASVPFWADDGTGRVRVDPAEAEVVVTAAARVRTGVFAHPSAEWSEVVARVGEPQNPPVLPFLRWREEFLEAGDVVTVVGRAVRDDEGAWAIVATEDAFVVSDRDDADVVRHHRRLGRRWALSVGAGTVVLGWGLWSLLIS
jgi:hypothetical protein